MQTPSLRIPDRAAMLGRRPRIPRGPASPGDPHSQEGASFPSTFPQSRLSTTGNSRQRVTIANRPLSPTGHSRIEEYSTGHP